MAEKHPAVLDPSLFDLIEPLAMACQPLHQAGALIHARALVLKEEFESSRRLRLELRRNGGLETPMCKLNLTVRLRGGRPSMEWRRTTHRRGSKVFMRACPPTKLAEFTNELDHELVVRCESQLKVLRKYWSALVLIRRKVDAFLPVARKLVDQLDRHDERDHLPVGVRTPPSRPATILRPTEFPAIRSDD